MDLLLCWFFAELPTQKAWKPSYGGYWMNKKEKKKGDGLK